MFLYNFGSSHLISALREFPSFPFPLFLVDIQLGLYETTGAGYGLIINIVNFVPSHLSTRDGSDKDAKKVEDMLMERDFTVDCFTDCTAGQIRAHLEMIGKDQNRCVF